jgi:hypothetical protein
MEGRTPGPGVRQAQVARPNQKSGAQESARKARSLPRPNSAFPSTPGAAYQQESRVRRIDRAAFKTADAPEVTSAKRKLFVEMMEGVGAMKAHREAGIHAAHLHSPLRQGATAKATPFRARKRKDRRALARLPCCRRPSGVPSTRDVGVLGRRVVAEVRRAQRPASNHDLRTVPGPTQKEGRTPGPVVRRAQAARPNTRSPVS